MNALTEITAETKDPWYDRETDACDAWIDEIDPGNEQGAFVTALFTSETQAFDYPHDRYNYTAFRLVGLRVETLDGSEIKDRDWCLRRLGADAVNRLETCEMEAA